MSDHAVLVSYSSKDLNLAKTVIQSIESLQIKCWAAYKDIKTGETWPAAISDGINCCKIFILILTSNSNTSRHVIRELTQADNLNKKLYCIQTEDILVSPEIRYFFSSTHKNEAFRFGIDNALKKMKEDIKSHLLSGSHDISTDNGNDNYKKNKKKEFLKLLVSRKLLFGAIASLTLIAFIYYIVKKSNSLPQQNFDNQKFVQPNASVKEKNDTASIPVYRRKYSVQHKIKFKSNKIQLSFYDNGEVDGDTVSVLLDGGLILEKIGLDERAISKTIDLTGRQSSILVIFSESLGIYRPTTGLLIIREGPTAHQIRFSSDFQQSDAIIFLREEE